MTEDLVSCPKHRQNGRAELFLLANVEKINVDEPRIKIYPLHRVLFRNEMIEMIKLIIFFD